MKELLIKQKFTVMKKMFTLLFAGILVLSLSGCATSNKDEDSDLFRNMKTVDLKGNQVDSSIFADNKVTLVNVWNVGCTPCVQELAALDRLNTEFEGKGVAIKGLYCNFSSEISEDERAEINDILTTEGAKYQQWTLSPDMLNSDTFQNWSSFPGTFLVDSQGNIMDRIEGSDDYDGWKDTIENALRQVEDNA